MCGGSLISSNVVMTAAHCLNAGGDICGTTESDYMLKKIKFGHAKLSSKISKQVDIDIGSIQHHPNYQPCFRGYRCKTFFPCFSQDQQTLLKDFFTNLLYPIVARSNTRY